MLNTFFQGGGGFAFLVTGLVLIITLESANGREINAFSVFSHQVLK